MKIRLKYMPIAALMLAIIQFGSCTEGYFEYDFSKYSRIVGDVYDVYFYDNYGNDADSMLVASLHFEEGSFADSTVINMQVINEDKIASELFLKNYMETGGLNKNGSSGSFFYFTAQDYHTKEMITQSKKEFTIRLNAKISNPDEGVKLFRILIPTEPSIIDEQSFTPTISMDNAGFAATYDEDIIAQLIDGDIMRTTTGLTFGSGNLNLSNWDEFATGVLNSDGYFTFEFSVTDFNYIYILGRSPYNFELTRDLSVRQPGVGLLLDDDYSGTIETIKPGSEIESYYYVTIASDPKQEYYYKYKKSTKKLGSNSLFSFMGSYLSNNARLPLDILEEIHEFYPNDTITSIRFNSNNNHFEAVIGDNTMIFTETGLIVSNEPDLPELVRGQIETYLTDFSTITDVTENFYDNDERRTIVSISNGMKFYLDENYKIYSVTDNDFTNNLMYNLIYSSLLAAAPGAEISTVNAYVNSSSDLEYVITTKSGAIVYFDVNGDFIEMEQASVAVNSLPNDIVNNIAENFSGSAGGPIINENLTMLNYGVDGRELYQIELNDGRIVVYFKPGDRFELFETIDNYQDLGTEIRNDLNQNYSSYLTAHTNTLYYLTSEGIVQQIVFDETQTPDLQALTYTRDGTVIGKTTKITAAELPSRVSDFLNKYAENPQITAISEKSLSGYSRYKIVLGYEQTVWFDNDGSYIRGLDNFWRTLSLTNDGVLNK